MTDPAHLRVLVTGASGFIGRNLLAAAPRTWEVVALTRQAGPANDATFVRTPTSDEPLAGALARRFDVVIHLAGNANHGLAVAEPWSDLMATGVLAASLLGRVAADRIVLLSSAAVYAGRSGRVDPGMCLQPLMAYALSKLYVEGLVETLRATSRVSAALTLRLYNAFGPGEREGRLVPRVVAAAHEDAVFTLTGHPESLSDPIHVADVVRALVAAAETNVQGTFDLCGGEPVPLRAQVDRITDALHLGRLTVVNLPRDDEVAIAFWSDPTPLWSALGIPAPGSFTSSVGRYGLEMGWIAG